MLYSCFRARVIDEVRLIYFIANKVLKKTTTHKRNIKLRYLTSEEIKKEKEDSKQLHYVNTRGCC